MFWKTFSYLLAGFFKKHNLLPGINLPTTRSRLRRDWAIGIYTGRSPVDLSAPEDMANPVLTRENFSKDFRAGFVADPFIIKHHAIWYMFFEVMNRESGKGEIGLATSEDTRKWAYRQIVLEEPFHLSYPYVFEWENDFYMLPETCSINAVRLYKATEFPAKWSLVGTLLEGRDYKDPSPFFHNKSWWLFTGHGANDTLRLYYADKIFGPWFEHPKSPIIEGNPCAARPAGRVLVFDDRIIRFAQSCYPAYGMQVRAFEILDITMTNYREAEIAGKRPVLTGNGAGWNAAGMHHIDAHVLDDGTWLGCVDGFSWLLSHD